MFTDLAKPPGLSFRLQKCQDISFSYWALHVPDDGSIAVIHELNAHLWKDNMLVLRKRIKLILSNAFNCIPNLTATNHILMSNYNMQYLEISINIMRENKF